MNWAYMKWRLLLCWLTAHALRAQMTGIENVLCGEMLLHVFFFVGGRSLNSMSRTCHQVHTALKDPRCCIQQLLLRQPCPVPFWELLCSADIELTTLDNLAGLRAFAYAPFEACRVLAFHPEHALDRNSVTATMKDLKDAPFPSIDDIRVEYSDEKTALYLFEGLFALTGFEKLRTVFLFHTPPCALTDCTLVSDAFKDVTGFVCIGEDVSPETFAFIKDHFHALEYLSIHDGSFDDSMLTTEGITSLCDCIGELKHLSCLKIVNMLDDEDSAVKLCRQLTHRASEMEYIHEIDFSRNHFREADIEELLLMGYQLFTGRGLPAFSWRFYIQARDEEE